jgi:hypothetical protein
LSASPRKHKRQRPNLRRKARGRPQMEQRLRCWVENLGFLFVLAIFAVVAIVSFAKYQILSAVSLLPERHSKMLEQRPRRIVVTRRGNNRYVHALQLVDLRVVNFRKDQLVTQAQGVIATAIK